MRKLKMLEGNVIYINSPFLTVRLTKTGNPYNMYL
jgi:hypothetical protein